MGTLGQRLTQAFEAKNTTAYKVAKATGVSASTIGRILKDEGNPNASTIDAICNHLRLNHEWVTVGSGEMENFTIHIESPDSESVKLTSYKPNGNLIPAFNTDFIAGTAFEGIDNQETIPDFFMDIPDFRGCTAFKAYSDSMEGRIKSGSWLFGTKVDHWAEYLEFGQIYGIVCNDGRKFLKYIKRFKEDPREFFLLVSENDFYDDFEMPKARIRSIWLIHGHLTKSV